MALQATLVCWWATHKEDLPTWDGAQTAMIHILVPFPKFECQYVYEAKGRDVVILEVYEIQIDPKDHIINHIQKWESEGLYPNILFMSSFLLWD